MSISVLGAGTWGTALAILLANKGYKVVLWSKLQREIDALASDRTKVPNLPGSVLPDSIELSGDTEYVCKTSEPDVIVFAVASPFVRATANLVAPFVRDGQKIVDVAKGIEEKTLFTLSEIIKDEIPQADVSVLSGPSHAEEVSRLIPTSVVIANKNMETAKYLQDIFMTERFRVYTSTDVKGVELGGSLKNVIALAAGMSDGLGYGDNTKAALMTRGIAEISRLGIKMGCDPVTFFGLSGVGDLFVTCTSVHSRNWNAGNLIGKGYSAKEAMDEVKQVVEGVFCAKAALELAHKYEVEMPIVEQMNKIIFENKAALLAANELLIRDSKSESNNNYF